MRTSRRVPAHRRLQNMADRRSGLIRFLFNRQHAQANERKQSAPNAPVSGSNSVVHASSSIGSSGSVSSSVSSRPVAAAPPGPVIVGSNSRQQSEEVDDVIIVSDSDSDTDGPAGEPMSDVN